MQKLKSIQVLLLFVFLICSSQVLSAASLKEAMDEAAEYFTKTAIHIEPGQELYVDEIINFHSQKHDQDGKKIETELYFAIEKQLPDFKLFLGRGKDKTNEIYLSGSYERKAETTTVKLVITRQGQVLAQKEVIFDNEATRRKTLIAVLDLESETLNTVQRKAFSDIFRSKLSQYDLFDIASSADIDKMDPDQIQQATGCTRDSCATIIGEQLGVDRVISSSMYKVSDELYVLSAKMMDIQEGSILVSKTVNHTGKLSTLADALGELAFQLTGEKTKIKQAEERIVAQEPEEEPVVEEEQLESAEGGGPSMIWHLSALGLAAFGGMMAQNEIASYNDLKSKNEDLAKAYETAVLQSEIAAIQAEFEDNEKKMDEHKSNIGTYNSILVVGLLWETYLVYAWLTAPDQPVEDANSLWIPDDVRFIPVTASHNPETRISVSWNW